LVVFDLQQISTFLAHEHFGQRPLRIDGIARQQFQHGEIGQQLRQVFFQHGRFVGFLTPYRPLAKHQFQPLHEDGKYLHRLAMRIETLTTGLRVDSRFQGCVGQGDVPKPLTKGPGELGQR